MRRNHMYYSRSAARGLGFLLLLAAIFFTKLFDFLKFLVEEHPYVFVASIGLLSLLIFKLISIKWRPTPSHTYTSAKTDSPFSSLVGRKDILINGVVHSISSKKKSTQPDRYHIDWDGQMILLNVWKKQWNFHVVKGKRYVFSHILCRINKYNSKIEFHYDPEYYGSSYQEWPSDHQRQENQSHESSSSLQDLLKEFGCPRAASIEEVKLKRRYWNQVLHPDFNVGKPEKLRNQMEEELKRKNELYDRIISLMNA
jgi:hypothetical protein